MPSSPPRLVHCCAVGSLGLPHNDYIDANTRFNQVGSSATCEWWEGANENSKEKEEEDRSATLSPCLGPQKCPPSTCLLRQSTEDRLSEHYAEFPDPGRNIVRFMHAICYSYFIALWFSIYSVVLTLPFFGFILLSN